MTATDRHADAVVIGAGAIGLASAWRLAQRGLAVEVVDPAPGSGASGVAAGMLAPVTEARLGEEALLQLSMASWARWPEFAADVSEASGHEIGYRADGTVVVALDADDRAVLVDVVDRQRAMGLDVEDLAVDELRRLEPALAPPVRRGVRAAGERSVDPPALVAALLAAAEDAGVRIWPVRASALMLTENNAVTGVELDSGDRLAAGVVVLAAGCWSDTVDGRPGGLPAGVLPPVRPVKGQVVTLRQRPGDTLVHHTVRGYVRGAVIYLVPRDDGRLVCGATVEERAWDDRVTAGGAYELLRDVLALFPGLDDAELAGVQAGFRPGTPDDLPLIGHAALDGLIIATGHYRNGILLTPITAEAVTSLVVGSSLPHEVAVCDPRRFAGTSLPTPPATPHGTQGPGAASADAPAADFDLADTRTRVPHGATQPWPPRGTQDLKATHTDPSSVAPPRAGNPAEPDPAATSGPNPPTPSHGTGRGSSEGITVVVNGEVRAVEGSASLDELVTSLELERQGLAIAVDDEVVPRSAWGAHRLTDSSRVEILTVAQGG